MERRIQILDSKTINQIAAGEVIENASSCIKELIENAIDSGASEIEVRFIAGGKKKIEVIDNGCGMSRSDARLALKRHATSKIQKIEDMDELQTMGFRGEALPSMASISKFRLKTSNGDECSEIYLEGGKHIETVVGARERGTSIEISSLFYNVPARQKFQKSIAQESRSIIKCFCEFALSYPHISFKLIQDHKLIYDLKRTAGEDFLVAFLARISKLFGHEMSKNLISLDMSENNVSLKGFLGSFDMHRPSRSMQHLFINGRFVDSKWVSLAIRDGYSTRLPENRFPIFFLMLSIDPQEVDVNVHPQKKEVRFKNPMGLQEILRKFVDQTLQNRPKTPFFKVPLNQNVFFKKVSAPAPVFKDTSQIVVLQEEQNTEEDQAVFFAKAHIIGIFDPYILVSASSVSEPLQLSDDSKEGIVFIHQRKAQACIMYEAFVHKAKNLSVQNLMLAKTFEFSKNESSLLKKYLPEFENLGIGLRLIGDQSFMLDALPSMMPIESCEYLIEGALEELKICESQTQLKKQNQNQLAKIVSQKVRPTKVANLQQAEHILEKLFLCQNFQRAPNGEKTFRVLTQKEMSKWG